MFIECESPSLNHLEQKNSIFSVHCAITYDWYPGTFIKDQIFLKIIIYLLFIFGCVGSLFLCEGFL